MNSDRLALRTPLAVPRPGQSVRLALGGAELVLEATRGGHSLLWHAGREARRHVLGLPRTAALVLELRPPVLPVRLLLHQTLTLAAGARVRGYVQLPLVPTLCWHENINMPPRPLLEFLPEALQAEWDDERGALHSCSSSWFVRYPVHGGEPRVTLPLWLHNRHDETCSPHHLPLTLSADEVVERRIGIGAAPRRMSWDGAQWHTEVRRPSAAEVGA